MVKVRNEVIERIKKYDGFIISTDTLKPEHLISGFLSVLEPCNEIQEILFNPLTKDKREICDELWEVLRNVDIGTDEYYFGTSDGDGACIGWFNINNID